MGRRRTARQGRRAKKSSGISGAKVAAIVAVPFAMLILMVAGLSTLRDAAAPPPAASGQRVVASGSSDATRVLAPERFRTAGVRDAYEIAHRIPETLNQLFCWCGCVANGTHRSALECFESTHAAECTICIANARIAWDMRQQGITDPGAVQRELDRRFGGLL